MNKNLNNSDPPKWADRFFEWYCNPDMQEEIQGDLYESFVDKAEMDGFPKARRWYWLQVFLFINRRTLSRKNHYSTQLNSIDMFRNYFKTGFRNILKNKGTTFINAFGMSLALGVCMTVFLLFDWVLSADSMHTQRDEIYIALREIENNDQVDRRHGTPQPLGINIKNDFPQVKEMVRVNFQSGTIRHKDQVFKEGVSFVDPAYFDLFDFPVKWGNPATFDNPEYIILSAPTAEKYFGSRNPIGETLEIQFLIDGKELNEPFVVGGVLEKRSLKNSFYFDFIIPFERHKIFVPNPQDWTAMSGVTFLQVKSPEALAAVKAKENKYVTLNNQANDDLTLQGFHFRPLKNITLERDDVWNSPFNDFDTTGLIMLFFMATSLLLLVCFNYINITLATATSRLKEISVRKVMGGSRSQVIWQFLTENLIICTLSLFLGIAFAYFIIVPWFNTKMGMQETPLVLNFDSNPLLWLFSIGLVVLTAIGGAGYPALYISKFQPVAILKKNFKLGSKNTLRRILIGVQLGLTVITIFSTIAFLFATDSLKNKDWGYQESGLGVIHLAQKGDFETFKNDIQSNAGIIDVTGSTAQMGSEFPQVKVLVNGKEIDVIGYKVAANYLNTLEIPVIEGRNFDAQIESDQHQSVLVNEAFRKKMNWEQATGHTLKIANQTYHIIGEVKDFHFESFMETIKPLIFQMGDKADFEYVSFRTLPGNLESTTKQLSTNWATIYPNIPFNYSFQDKVFYVFFRIFGQINGACNNTAILTLIIALIGLYGLAMLLLAQKMKELSIRKILGASIFNISHSINKEFFFPALFAILFGLPIGYFLVEGVLKEFAPEETIHPLPFLLTIGSILGLLIISLAKHIYAAAVSNPSKFLKDE